MNKRLDRAFLRATRTEVLTEHGGKCAYCFERLTQRTVTADHFKAKSKGGKDHKANIVPACKPCNSLKGSMSPNEFKKKIKAVTYREHGLAWFMIRFRRNINVRLDRMEERVMRAVRGNQT